MTNDVNGVAGVGRFITTDAEKYRPVPGRKFFRNIEIGVVDEL